MIDTLRVQWSGIAYNDAFCDWLLAEYPTASFATRWYDENLPWQGVTLTDPVFGTIGVKSNKLGNSLWVERSLPKFMYGDNCRVLSVEEAREGIAALMAGVEARFREWWLLPDYRSTARVQRLDLCYQQKVPCSTEVFAHLARCLNSKKVVRHQFVLCPVEVHLTGVTLKQSKLELGRWYDKGFESGDERYEDVVRHEEQLRAGKAGWLLNVSGPEPVVNVEAARERMNARYHDMQQLESYNLGALLDEHALRGAAAVALVLHPEYEPLYKQHLANGTYYNIRKLADVARRQVAPVDLRLPEDAWAEPMVL